jgi:hypothetical protein
VEKAVTQKNIKKKKKSSKVKPCFATGKLFQLDTQKVSNKDLGKCLHRPSA